MALKIGHFGRRIYSFRGILLSDTCLLSRNVHSFSSKISSNSSAATPEFFPINSIYAQDTLFSKKINYTNLIFSSPRLQILDRPVPVHNRITELPIIKTNITYEDKPPEKEIVDPILKNHIKKHAIRMIVIRKRKMRIHKLKKWRKKMKFVIAKYKQKKVMEKEKLFQAELMAKIKDAEKFDPIVYMKEKIKKADEQLIPKLWHGKRLPEFIIKDLMERKKKKLENRLAKIDRRKNMNVNASDYK